ncbi:MAG: T9SS type A sorting domain-containing protein [candidate division Zixibacteria bacterium]|nr:T9SS type A sorting domain-containing protein [candidate division Zixibacteria bacterium]
MKKYLIILLIIVSVLIKLTGLSSADNWEMPDPVFHKIDFLGLEGIEEFNRDFGMEIIDSYGIVFGAPFDAVVLHIDFGSEVKDIVIFSDPGLNGLVILQTHIITGSTGRVLETVTHYFGTAEDSLSFPHGIETTAKNRLFEPMTDLIYVADKGKSRIVALQYTPDENGGTFQYHQIITHENMLHPIDIALSAYGDQDPDNADLYVADHVADYEQVGALIRFSLDGTYENMWNEINFPGSDALAIEITKPISVICYPDTIENHSAIFITQEDNTISCVSSSTAGNPEYAWIRSLDNDEGYVKPGSIALDDYGRIYVANGQLGRIQTFTPYLEYEQEGYGEKGEGPGQLLYPGNIITDSYHVFCEALIFEFFWHQSGLQSFYIENGWSATKPAIGLAPGWQFIRPFVDTEELPRVFKLYNSYPNPFNSNCIISFDVPLKSKVTLDIYNILGQRVATPVDKVMESGNHAVNFRGDNMASGVYFYRLRTDNFKSVKKMMLLK